MRDKSKVGNTISGDEHLESKVPKITLEAILLSEKITQSFLKFKRESMNVSKMFQL